MSVSLGKYATLLSQAFRPKRRKDMTMGALYRVCEEAIAGLWSPELIQRWWTRTGKGFGLGDQECEAASVLWECLVAREIIPASWAEGGRWFHANTTRTWCDQCRRVLCEHAQQTCLRNIPWGLADCLVFAAHPEAIATAEALYKEYICSTRQDQNTTIVWKVLPNFEATTHLLNLENLLAEKKIHPLRLAILQTGYDIMEEEQHSYLLARET